ncbi:vWA domain-containing protein [Stackebrandtia nassauensis]|uniref:von Willebrand factor type A n=1 Tax=Stackebrandtia nassauensis (strain DSM 44728 / CIP 108903 / NRRL B-16338 / NBRC 102104 / LLR-40K-21) TaxID=446470 RepID=D3PYC5_STANL|nr:VWA domain-containing protein [Stackebrandtia nassauensis]ADD41492.1 von Willebrand factor type A [Stackebrandtia nassauensis DSM 44728]
MGSPNTRRVLRLAATTVILGGFAVVGTAAPASAADNDGELLMALDASGSMEESDGAGNTKMETARDAVIDVAEAMPGHAKVGLRAYGPASTGSGCKASKELVPIDKIDADAITTAATELKPEGDTPIAYSLEKAAGDFTEAKGPKTILLVSDGEETCGGDPVKVAEKIASQGVDLRVHVIGFQVDDATRKQLTEIAKAGKGSYYDAQDGPALASRLKRASESALRPYQTTGTQIDGSDDGLNPPSLKPGQYLDSLGPNAKGEEPSKYYSFTLEKGSNAYVAATIPWSTPLETDAKNDVYVKVSTKDGSLCESDSGYSKPDGGGSAIATATPVLAFDPEADKGQCGATGDYVVEVNNNGSTDRTGEAPLELVYVQEPAAKATGKLPEAYTEESETGVKPDVDGKPTKITGAGGMSDAPVTESGVYSDVLRPGEEVFYRVPVDWGQQVAYQIDLPKLNAENDKRLGTGTPVSTTIVNPVREEATQTANQDMSYYTGDPDTVDGSTAPVRYRNRNSDNIEVSNTSISGYYYISVRMQADVEDPYFELPITLKVDVKGKTGGEPKYDDPADLGTPAEQLEVKQLSSEGGKDKTLTGGSTTLLWIGIGVGAVLVLGGGGTAWMMVRRRPTA